ncbi:rod shape-determining protein MreC [Cetobacterium sp. 2A]|uniref:rod shape-determining protein MreC n=1 Tax=Cetobacterium sp. 2A TaxID=2754723 RepID=UPI00163BC8DC|nr:rod shape-determining protein MreC [Cetobacterium sp. 2A]MBC2856596.1 rod shape-determining protein MreC [Cetobacterium sp. 2A]
MRLNRGNKKSSEILYIIIAITIMAFVLKGVVKYFNEQISDALLPLQSKIYLTGEDLKNKIENIKSYNKTYEENSDLRKQVSEKQMLEEETKYLREENRRLRELLAIKGEFNYNFKIGKVSFHQVRELYESFSISLGSENGMKKNMVVLSGKNLIGKVDKVINNYSTVQMITDQEVVVSVLTENNLLGIVRGDRSNQLFFEPSSMYEVELKVGDKVYTSGVSDIYPKGIYVGYISEVNEDEKNPMKKYKVGSEIDIFDLNEVIIMIGDENNVI